MSPLKVPEKPDSDINILHYPYTHLEMSLFNKTSALIEEFNMLTFRANEDQYMSNIPRIIQIARALKLPVNKLNAAKDFYVLFKQKSA